MAYSCEANVKSVSKASGVPENTVRDHARIGKLNFDSLESVCEYVVYQRLSRKGTVDAYGEPIVGGM